MLNAYDRTRLRCLLCAVGCWHTVSVCFSKWLPHKTVLRQHKIYMDIFSYILYLDSSSGCVRFFIRLFCVSDTSGFHAEGILCDIKCLFSEGEISNAKSAHSTFACERQHSRITYAPHT